jgi:hypothetical protein
MEGQLQNMVTERLSFQQSNIITFLGPSVHMQKRLRSFPLLASCIEFAETPMEAPLHDSITDSHLLIGETREASNHTKHIQKYNSAMAFESMGADIKSPPGNGPYCFRLHDQLYHLVSLLYPKEKTKPEHGQGYIFNSAEATTKGA